MALRPGILSYDHFRRAVLGKGANELPGVVLSRFPLIRGKIEAIPPVVKRASKERQKDCSVHSNIFAINLDGTESISKEIRDSRTQSYLAYTA